MTRTPVPHNRPAAPASFLSPWDAPVGVRMADWHKAADYNFPKTFSPYRWAWEFLRRNPEYRKDWTAALSRFRAGKGEFEGWSEGARDDNPEDPDFWLIAEERGKWCLDALLNPATDLPTHLSFNLGFGSMEVLAEGASFMARGPTYPIVEFNLLLPLAPQLASAERKLKQAQSWLKIKTKRSKHSRALWARYLRLLDARLDGRSPTQIANELEKEEDGLDEKKVWDRLQAAEELTVPTGYLSIVRS
ncbi:MAG: DUF6499 domain-containing protein [Thermoanaerobaculia bacterium]